MRDWFPTPDIAVSLMLKTMSYYHHAEAQGGRLADDYCRDFKNTARQYCRQDETKRFLLNYGSGDEGEATAIKYPSRKVRCPHQAMISDTTRG